MILEHGGKRPRIHASAYVAPNATICGEVTVGAESRVLFGAVLTAESGPVAIGDPVRLHSPKDHDEISKLLAGLDFAGTVFGDQAAPRGETRMPERSRRYARALGAHKDDRIVEP